MTLPERLLSTTLPMRVSACCCCGLLPIRARTGLCETSLGGQQLASHLPSYQLCAIAVTFVSDLGSRQSLLWLTEYIPEGHQEAEDAGLDEVRTEHERQLEALRQQRVTSQAPDIKSSSDLTNRLAYLMQQSEIFTHFLESTNFGKPSKKGKGDRTRMKETEEDTIMMKQAQTKARVTRVLKQPSSIVFGTMRDYQLEGLNWMLKLHDNGINGILADEMVSDEHVSRINESE